MAQDRGADRRVDSWDEDAQPVPPEGSFSSAALLPAAPAGDGRTDAAGVPGAEQARPDPPWREMIRGTPLWLWLISCLSIGAICAMLIIVLLVASSLK